MIKIKFAIFAKHGTREKAIIPVWSDQTHAAMIMLNETYGGDWIYVDMIKPGEGVKFNDGMIYRGYTPEIERYSDALFEFENKTTFLNR